MQSVVGAALAAITGPQTKIFCSHYLPAIRKPGLYQSRLWTFLLAWSQEGPEKFTSEATAINGITALLGTTVPSLSFPLQHCQTLLLSSSQYLVLFVCFVLLSLSSHHPQQMQLFLFYSPTLCSLRALPGCTALPEESWRTSTDVINNVGSFPCSFLSLNGA